MVVKVFLHVIGKEYYPIANLVTWYNSGTNVIGKTNKFFKNGFKVQSM